MNRFQTSTHTLQHTPGSRRILAFVLVVCLAALQCMLLSPVLTEQSYAADSITVDAEYQDESSTYASQTLDGGTISGLKQHTETIKVEDEETGEVIEEYELSGPSLKAVLGKTGISSKVDKVIVGGYEVDGWSNEKLFLAIEGGSYNLYKGKELLVEGVDNIYVRRSSDLKPVSFKSRPASSKTTPTVGDTIKISYKLNVDEFYKKSDGFNMEDATRLTWSANKKVTLLSKTTTGTSGTIKAKVKKPGTINIRPESGMFPSVTDGVSVSFTGMNTTTTATTTRYTASTYRPYTPTTRSTYTAGTTGSTAPTTTAPRPEDTTATMAPSYQTIRVKEVYLMETTAPVDPADPYAEDSWEDDPYAEDDMGEDDPLDEETPEDNGVTFPAAAGSAAAAIAACGVGAVGRIRRFRTDMGPLTDAAAAGITGGAGASGGRKFSLRKKSAAGQGLDGTDTAAAAKQAGGGKAPDGPGGSEEQQGKNPLKKFRRKK